MNGVIGTAAFREKFKRLSKWLALPAFLLILGSATAYFQAFCGRKPFDDEGLLIASLRSAIHGQILYNQVHSFYGPAYFLYQELAHLLLGRQLPTNDSVRLISIFFWVLTAVSTFILVRDTVKSWIIALGAYFLVFRAARFAGEEPGHPQELILFLTIMAMIAAAAHWRTATRLAMLGGIAAALTFTKVNAGLFMLLILGIATASRCRVGVRQKQVEFGCWLAAMSFAPLLLWPNLNMPWARHFLAVELCSLAAVLITVWPANPGIRFEVRALAPAAGGFGLIAAAVIVFAMARGSSLAAMIDWIFVRPRSAHGTFWFLAPAIPWPYLFWAAAAPVAALFGRARYATPGRIAAIKIAAGSGVMLLAATSRYGALLFLAPPLMWLIAIPRAGLKCIEALARALLALTGVVFLLYAYPVAGVQVRLVDVVLIVIAVLILGDGLGYASAVWGPSFIIRAGRRVGPIAGASVLIFGIWTLAMARTNYSALMPLNLPGSARLRLPAEETRGLRAIISRSRESCSVLVTLPAMLSFNHWSELPSISSFTYSNWVTGYNDVAQRKIIQDLAAAQRPCVIENPEMIAFWTHGADVSSRPIILYVRQHFREVMAERGNHLLLPNGSE